MLSLCCTLIKKVYKLQRENASIVQSRLTEWEKQNDVVSVLHSDIKLSFEETFLTSLS